MLALYETLILAACWFSLAAWGLRKSTERRRKRLVLLLLFGGVGVSAALLFLPYRDHEILVQLGLWGSLCLVFAANWFIHR